MRRRQFLAGAGAGLLLGARVGAAEPRCSAPSDPRARLAVASYPFRKDLDPRQGGRMKLLDFPKFVVETYKVPGVEPLDEHFAGTDEAYLARFRTALDDAKAHVVNIPVGRLHGSFYDPDTAKRETAVSNAKKWVDVAVAIGSPSIRTHVQGVQGVTPDATRAAESLKRVAEYGQSKGAGAAAGATGFSGSGIARFLKSLAGGC